MMRGINNFKPLRTNVVGAGQVHPNWRWVWRDMIGAWLMWDGRFNVRNVAIANDARGIATAPSGTPALATTGSKYGLGFSSAGSTTGAIGFQFDSPIFRLPGSFTLAMIMVANFNSSDSIGGGSMLWSKGLNLETAGNNHNWLMGYDKNTFNDDQAGNGFFILFERSDSAGTNVSAKWVTTLTAGTRFLLMGVLDTARDELRLYFNGVKVRTRSTTFTAETNAIDLVWGRFAHDSDATFHRWKGTYEACWMWKNRAFTDGEAACFARAPYAAFTPARVRRSAAIAASQIRNKVIVVG